MCKWHKFNTRNQQSGKTTDEYVTDLHSKAKTCEFWDLTEGLIRDCIMCAIFNDKKQSHLLKKANLTLKPSSQYTQGHATRCGT